MGKKYNVVFNSLSDNVKISGNTTSALQYSVNWASFLPKTDGKRYRCTFSFKSYTEDIIVLNQNIMISMNLGNNNIYQNSRKSNIIGTVSSVLNGGTTFSITSRGKANMPGTNQITISSLEGFISDNSILTIGAQTVEILKFISGTNGGNGVYQAKSAASVSNEAFHGRNGSIGFYSCNENDNPSFDIEYPQNNEVIIEILNFNNKLLRTDDYNQPLDLYFTLDYVLILQLEEI
jgi:hypothetical protein